VTLRARLFAAIGLVTLLSLALALAIGAVLTRRAVERNTLGDVSAKFDVIVAREKQSVRSFARLAALEPFLERQNERVVRVPLDGSSELLPSDRAALLRRGARLDGTLQTDGTRYFYSARLVRNRGYMLLRPTSATESAWRPQVRGLMLAAAGTAALAFVFAFLLARAISRPVRRVAEATRGLAASPESTPRLPVEGPRELQLLAESFNELAVQLAKAREAERAFLLSVSHELKTPLTAIRGYAEGLGEGALPADEAASTIVRESHRLERLVGDLLDLGRMRKAEFSFRSELVDLSEVSAEVVRRYEQHARDFGVTLESNGAEDAPALADADRVLQAVSNLVENALRLTPAGGRVRVVAAPGSIRVEDTGPGLPPEDLRRAFERFYLHSRYGRERRVGTGLGLAIVKALAEGMGGSVVAESEPDRLTVFTIRLPLPPPAAALRRGGELARV
jgi:two-component system sensor histidine kinase BaeS